jgi:fermentation-respiration switch protein FrsA (DUF1100 family)
VRARRWWHIGWLVLGVGALTSCGAMSRALIGGAPSAIGPAPAELGATTVSFASSSGSQLRGWFIPGRRGGGAVLLLHGVNANRLAMLPRAGFLHALGYSVLLPDFRAHGESTGDHTTFGALESRDAYAAACLLHRLAPQEHVGAIGVSLGGAATLLGPTALPVDALVLESVYPTIDRAARNRLRTWLGPIGSLLAPALVRSLEPAVGVRRKELRPIDRIGEVKVPLLMVAGTADRYTPLDESKALYARVAAPKEFWAVPGADHVDLYAFAPEAYRERISAFLERSLTASTYVPGSGAGCS